MKRNGEFVGVDDKFIPENEKYVDDSIIGNKEESDKKAKKIAKGFGIGFICWVVFVIALMIGIAIFAFTMINNTKKAGKDIMISAKQLELLNQAQQILQ